MVSAVTLISCLGIFLLVCCPTLKAQSYDELDFVDLELTGNDLVESLDDIGLESYDDADAEFGRFVANITGATTRSRRMNLDKFKPDKYKPERMNMVKGADGGYYMPKKYSNKVYLPYFVYVKVPKCKCPSKDEIDGDDDDVDVDENDSNQEESDEDVDGGGGRRRYRSLFNRAGKHEL